MVGRNFLVNAAGRIWNAALGFLVVPVIVRLLGVESYGLVAFYVTLTIAVNLLDLGFTATMNRQMARFAAVTDKDGEARDFAHSMQVIYWAIGIVLGALIVLLAPWISAQWLTAGALSEVAVTRAVALMGVLVALEWPITMYGGGLIGLERQVVFNVLSTTVATLRNAGAVAVLWLFTGNVETYFRWQLIASLCASCSFLFAFWRCMPRGQRPLRFVPALLRPSVRFAAGMSVSSILAFIASNVDKILLSRVLPLVEFGYYNIGNQVSNATRMMPSAVVSAVLPRLTVGFARSDIASVAKLYHTATQLMVAIVVPTSAVLVVYMPEILGMWTGSAEIAGQVWLIASLLVIGSAINSIVSVPYYLSVAQGWSAFGAIQNTVAVIIVTPLMIFLVYKFGGNGAAVTWVFLNIGYLLVSPVVIMRKVLPDELRTWYLTDVFVPSLLAVVVAVVGRVLSMSTTSVFVLVAAILVTWIAANLACLAVLPELSRWLRASAVRYIRRVP